MLNKIVIDDKKVPYIFLFILIATFGLLIPKLGFYWDDWPVMFMTQTQGTTGFWDFYQYDRPFSAWTYIVTTPMLGTNPMGWHIFTLLLRWLTVVFLWLTLRKLWPGNSRQTFWIALLFSVYPLFDQQSVAVAYSQHWTCYLFYFISIYLMLLSQEKKRLFYPLTLLAVSFSLTQMLTMEYFLGLEFARPIILWIYYFNQENKPKKQEIIKKTLVSSWFYLALFIAYIIWRVNFQELAGDNPNKPVLLKQLLDAPFQSLLGLLQTAMQDLVYFILSWFQAINPSDIELQRPFFIVSTAVAFTTALLLWFILGHYSPSPPEENKAHKWPLQATLFGIVSTVVATIPVWMIGRQASLGLYGSRFGLAGMFGLSIMLVGILEWLSTSNSVKNIVICLLIGVAIHFHLYTSKDFQDSWEKQQRVYWQLYWRAPYIEPGTAIISDGEIFNYVGLYSTSMGISLLYPPTENPQELAYWFFSMGRDLFTHIDELNKGTILTGSLRNYSFEGNSREVLILWLPGKNRCIKILTENDLNDRDIPEILQPVISLSNPDRIKRSSASAWSPPETIFGKEPEHTWCYFYEKAELAGQYQDWEEIIQLYQITEQQGYKPSDMNEYLPLLDAYLHSGRIDDANQLSIKMRKLSNKIDDQICWVWVNNIEEQRNLELYPAFENIKGQLNCFD